MKYTNLGSTGLRVSRICLGMMSYGNDSDRPWVLDEDAAEPIVKAAVDGGITFFDTADVYSAGASEVATGRLLGKFFDRDRGRASRPRCTVPMRPGPERSRAVAQAHHAGIDASLRRLGIDYVDLYQIHRWDTQHADRGDDRGAARRREGRQGPLHRRELDVRLAVRQGAARGRRARLDQVRARCRTTTTCSTARKSGR